MAGRPSTRFALDLKANESVLDIVGDMLRMM